MNQVNPPHDGTEPCPACPHEVRGLYAVVANVLTAYDGSGAERFQRKFIGMKEYTDTASMTWFENPDVLAMYHAALDAIHTTGNSFGVAIEKLREAKEKVEPLIDKHFADPAHSHGYVSQPKIADA